MEGALTTWVSFLADWNPSLRRAIRSGENITKIINKNSTTKAYKKTYKAGQHRMLALRPEINLRLLLSLTSVTRDCKQVYSINVS